MTGAPTPRSTTRARRRRWVLLLLVLACGFVATAPLSGPAGAQDTAGQLEQLRGRNRDLDARIVAEDKNVADADARITALERDLQKAGVQLDVLADQYARVVDGRREPARTRVAFAIDAYVRGDPLLASIVEELLNMTSRTEDITQREFYRVIVDDADKRLQVIDQQLRELAGQVSGQQNATKGVRDQLTEAQQRRQGAVDARQRLAAERADVVRQIQDIEARASRAVLTGTSSFEDANRPALVVKIDNVEAARPQYGINQADVVFEEEVEGGLTRFAAVFHSRGADPVGPIRSVRTTDVNLFSNLNKPLFSSSGGNAGTRAALLDSTLVDVGPTEYPGIYYRESSRNPPNNFFSRTSDMWASAAGSGGRPPALFSFRSADAPRPASAIASSGVDVNFGSARIAYSWNGTGWARTQAGRAHVDASGRQVAPVNVIVQFTDYGRSSADESSPEAIVTGSGDAWVFTNGYVVRGTWTRRSITAVTSYTDESGNPIALAPGSTWIALPRPGRATLR